MSKPLRTNRKISDQDVIKLNAVGLSFTSIAKRFNCHPSSISERLNNLGIEPANTRRGFMEDIFNSLSPDQQNWLFDRVGSQINIKDLVTSLIVEASLRTANQPRNHDQ